MGGYLYCVPGTSFYWYAAFQASNLDEEKTTLYRRSTGYTYDEFRSPARRSSHIGYGWEGQQNLWPSRSGFCQDPASLHILMQDQDNAGWGWAYECWRRVSYGGQSAKFIMGQVLDSGGIPISGAVVKGFRTSDGLFAGQTISSEYGRYELPCAYTPNDAHFLVAYVDAGTDQTGATVNTLVPTNRDGSP